MAPAPLTAADFQRQSGVGDEVLQRLRDYVALLERWNPRTHLVAPASLRDVWRRHILDCAQIAALAPGEGPWLDLGSGAGLPGLIVALLGRADVHLVESSARKAAFLREAARITDTKVTVHRARVENLPPQAAAVISARALAPLVRLLPLIEPHLRPGGVCLLLKGQHVEDELTQAAKSWIMRVERIESRSDPAGVIVKLTEVADARTQAAN